jgi:aspartate aminotransferase
MERIMKDLSKKIQYMKGSSVRALTRYCNNAEAKGKVVHKLNIGQPDLHIPKEYYDYLRSFNEQPLEYMPSNGRPDLLHAIKGYYHDEGMDFGENDIAITTGGSEALLFTLHALTNVGDECIIFEPFYSNYNTFFTLSGMKPVAVTTYAERGFHFTKHEIEEKITGNTKAILVTNPGNPTGAVLSSEELKMIAEIACENDLYIIADEVYREIVFDGLEISSFGLIKGIDERLIIIDSISKRFCACGARIGMIISKNKPFMSIISKLCQGRLAASAAEQWGAVGLYSTGLKETHLIRDEFQKRRDVVYQNLRNMPGAKCARPEGAFYIVAKIPVADASKFLIWMLEEYQENGETVMAAPAEGFYLTAGLGRDEIRIAYVLDCEQLDRAMKILANGICAYNQIQ